MAELSEYDKYNTLNTQLAGPVKPKKEATIKAPKPTTNKYEALRQSGIETSVIGRDQSDVSTLDAGAVAGENTSEEKAYRQGGFDQYMRGAIKGTGLLGTTVASTFTALPYGILKASYQGAFDDSKSKGEAFSAVYDNEISDKLDDFNKNMEKWFPNYYSEKELKADAFSADNILSANFWGDKVIKNAGFTVGAIVGGKKIATGMQWLGKLAMSGRYAQELTAMNALISTGMKPAEAMAKVAKGIRAVDAATSLGASTIAAAGEGGMEAKQVKDELKESLLADYKLKSGSSIIPEDVQSNIERTASAAGNTTFAANMAILTASDYLQFGKLFSKGFKQEATRVGKMITEEGVLSAAKPTFKNRVASMIKSGLANSLTESAEEGSQTFTQGASKAYYTRQFDKGGIAFKDDAMMSMLKGLEDTFQNKEGKESMLLGFLTGLGSHAGVSLIQYRANRSQPSEYDVTSKAAEVLNKSNAKIQPFIDSYVRGVGLNADKEAILKSNNPSKFLFGNIAHDEFKNIVQPYIQSGKYDILEDRLKDQYDRDDISDWGNDSRKTAREYVGNLLTEAKRLRDSWDTVDTRFPNADSNAKIALWDSMTNIENRENRAKELEAKIALESGISYSIVTAAGKDFISEVQDAIDNGKVRASIEDAEDLERLVNEKKDLVTRYKQLLTPEEQEKVANHVKKVIEDRVKEDEVKTQIPISAEVEENITPYAESIEDVVEDPQATQIIEEGNPITEPEIESPEPSNEVSEPVVEGRDIEKEANDYAKTLKASIDSGENSLEDVLKWVDSELEDGDEDDKKLGARIKELVSPAVEEVRAIDNVEEVKEPESSEPTIEDRAKELAATLQQSIDSGENTKEAVLQWLDGELEDSEGEDKEVGERVKQLLNSDKAPEIIPTPEPIIEEELPTITEDDAIQSDYSEMDRMSDTGMRTTANHEEAIEEGLWSVVRYQNFINNPTTSLSGLRLKIITKSDPMYTQLLNKKQKAFEDNRAKEGKEVNGILAVVVDENDKIVVADTSGELLDNSLIEDQENGVDNLFQGPLVTTLVSNPSRKDNGYNAVSYQNFGRVNGFGNKVTEEEALNPNTPVGKAWKAHTDSILEGRQNMLNSSIKYLSITGASSGIFQNTNSSNELGATLGVDINSKDLSFVIPKIEDIETPGFTTIGNAEGLNKEQKVRVGKAYVIYNGRLYPLQARKLNRDEIDDITSMFELAYNNPNRRAYFISKIKELAYIKNNFFDFMMNPDVPFNEHIVRATLKEKYRQIDANKLQSNDKGKYEISSVTEKGVNTTKQEYTYRDFILTGEDRALSVNFNPHPTTVKDSPNYLNGYLTYKPVTELPKESINSDEDIQNKVKENFRVFSDRLNKLGFWNGVFSSNSYEELVNIIDDDNVPSTAGLLDLKAITLKPSDAEGLYNFITKEQATILLDKINKGITRNPGKFRFIANAKMYLSEVVEAKTKEVTEIDKVVIGNYLRLLSLGNIELANKYLTIYDDLTLNIVTLDYAKFKGNKVSDDDIQEFMGKVTPEQTSILSDVNNVLSGNIKTKLLDAPKEVTVEDITNNKVVPAKGRIRKAGTPNQAVVVKKSGGLNRLAIQKTTNKVEDIPALKKWWADKFNGESFEVVDNLINGNAFGEYTAAVTRLFNGAEEGTGYHEAWHKVTQEYLTPKQIASLYDKVREDVNSKFSDLEAEEWLAEEFRKFMLSGQKAIKNMPYTNNIFRKIYNWINSFITGKTTPQQIFDKLASKKGFTGAKKFNVQQFTKLERAIVGTTHAQTKNIVDTINGHFFNTLFESGLTPDEILSDNELVTNVYSATYNRALEDYNQILEDQDTYEPQEFEAIMEHYDLLLNINEEGEPTTLNKDAIKAHKEYLKTLGISLSDKVGEDAEVPLEEDEVDDHELGGEETGRSKAEWTNANEESTINSAPSSIKLLIMSLPEVNVDGEAISNSIGGPKLNDYLHSMKLLYSNLAGLSQFHEMYAKLQEISVRFPVFKELVNRLGDPGSEKSFEQFLLENDFRQAFSKFESKGTITLIDKNTGKIYQVDANANKLRDRIKENWVANLRGLANDKDSYITRNDDGVITIKPSFFTDARAGKFKGNAKAFFEQLGITFTDLSQEQVQDIPEIKTIQNTIFKYVAKAVEIDKVAINDLFTKDADIRGQMAKLLDIETPLSKEVVELSYISAEGKRIYAVSLNNYYSLTVNALNNVKTKDELFQRYPHLNNPYTQNSIWLKNLFDKEGNKTPGQKVYMNTISGLKIQNENESGIGATKMEPADKIVQEFNDLLTTGTASLIRAADKSSEYALGITSFNGDNLAITLEDIKKEGLANSKTHEIFMGYFNDELGRIRAFNNGVGKNIDIYNKQAGNFSLFGDILSPETLKELEAYKTTDEELDVNLEAKISEEIVNYLEQYSKDVKRYMQDRKVGLPTSKGFTGINPELTGKDEKGLDAAIQTFAVNHLINMIEQSKLLVGDSAFYKDKFKRISAGTGTKKLAASSQLVNNWFNNFYKNVVGRVDGKKSDGLVNVVIFADNKAKQSTFEDYVDALEKSGMDRTTAEGILDAYNNMDEGDAQGWITLDEYREFFMRVGAAYWTADHERQYRWEIANEKNDRGQELSEREQKALEGGNPQFYFMPIKAQHFGPQVMNNIYAPAFHKYSLAPLYHSLVKGRNMESLLNSMREKQVGYALFGSGSKVGTPVEANGKLPAFYNEEGVKGIGDATPIQKINYEFLGVQLDIAPKVKEKVIFGSQFRKLLFSNLFSETTKPEFTKLADEYNKLIDNLVTYEFDKLTKKLGIKVGKDGSYSFNGDYKKLVGQLKEALEDKDTADNILDSLQTNEDGSLKYPIDFMVNRPKIESMLFSIVNSKVIKQKMAGDGLVQLASTGFENKGKRTVGESNYLEFYSNKGKNGKTTPMEVEVPMMATFQSLLDKYKTIDAVNKAISEGKIDDKLLTLIGYRIPTQGLNSIDFMKIKRFLPESAGNAIILPTGVVAKSGGDYDIDKLNVFRPQMFYDEKNDYVGLYTQAPNAKQTKDTKASMQNRILEIATEVLSHPDNFIDLITPNTTDTLTSLVADIRKAQGQSGKIEKASATKEFRFDTIMEQFTYFLGGKAGVGIGAVHNTHHILSQIAGITLNTSIPFKHNTKEGAVDLSKLPKISIQMQPDNIDKIVSGTKTTTTRSASQAATIGLKPNTMGVLTFNGEQFYVRYRGAQTIEQAGGKEIIIKSEGVNSESDFKYQQTKDWINGKGELHIYDFKPVTSTGSQVDLSKQYTQGNQKISDLISQFINAYVDVAKDPFYKDLNAGTEVAGVWFYLMRAGVDVKTIGYFMTQPIIKEYVAARKLNNSLVVSSNGNKQGEYKVDLSDAGRTKIEERMEATDNVDYMKRMQMILDNGSVYNDILEKYGVDYKITNKPLDSDNINDTLLKYISEGSSGKYSKDFREMQTQLLEVFAQFEKEASELTLLMRDTNNDTTKLQNYGSIYKRDQISKDVRDSKIIPAGSSEKIKSKTIVGSFDISNKVSQMYSELTQYTSNPIVKTALDDLISQIDKKADFEKEYTKIQNDFIGYVTQKFAKTLDGQVLASKMSLLSGDNSLAKQLISLRKEGLEDIVNNPFVSELVSVINADSKSIDNIKLYSRRLSAFESNVYTEAFRSLLDSNNPKIQEFGRNLAYLTMLQSGLNNSPITFTELIPFEFYGDIVSGALNRINELDVDDFKKAYYNKLNSSYGFRLQDFGLADVPKIDKKIVAEDKQMSQQSDSTVDVFDNPIRNREEYIPTGDLTEEQQIQFDKNSRPFEGTKELENKPVDIEGDVVDTRSGEVLFSRAKIGQQQSQIREINKLSDIGEEDGDVTKTCKI